MNQVIEFADEMCEALSTALNLDRNIEALAFLRSDVNTHDSEDSE